MGYLEILLIAGLILINGFFVTAEFALVKVRATPDRPARRAGQLGGQAHQQGARSARLLPVGLADRHHDGQPGPRVGDARVGRARGEGGAGVPANLHVARIVVFGVSTGAVPIATLCLVTFLHMALGEQAPKTLAIREPKLLALLTAPPLVILSYVFSPVIWLLNKSSNLTLWVLGLGHTEHVRAGPFGRGAAPDRGRERGRRPPVAQRADDDRERAQPGGEDGAVG